MKRKNLQALKKLMKNVKKLKMWQDVCLANGPYDSYCSPDSIISPLKYIEADLQSKNIDNADQQDIDDSFKKIFRDKNKWEEIKSYFGG